MKIYKDDDNRRLYVVCSWKSRDKEPPKYYNFYLFPTIEIEGDNLWSEVSFNWFFFSASILYIKNRLKWEDEYEDDRIS